jgi:hypothetical protein
LGWKIEATKLKLTSDPNMSIVDFPIVTRSEQWNMLTDEVTLTATLEI